MAEKKLPGCVVALMWGLGGLLFLTILVGLLGRLLPDDETSEPTVTATPRYEEPEPRAHPLVEDDAIIASNMTESVIDALIMLTRSAGYHCDSVSAASAAVFTAGKFTLRCNQFRYKYLIEDRGGNWVVTVQ